jgi:hypothetical protein
MIVKNKKLGRNIMVLAIFLAFMGMGVVDPICQILHEN